MQVAETKISQGSPNWIGCWSEPHTLQVNIPSVNWAISRTAPLNMHTHTLTLQKQTVETVPRPESRGKAVAPAGKTGLVTAGEPAGPGGVLG